MRAAVLQRASQQHRALRKWEQKQFLIWFPGSSLGTQ